MPQTILSHPFDNGLTLVAEPMPWLESAAFALLLPAGCSRDPADKQGLANFTCEMAQRGCGSRNSRQFVEDLENLGVEHGGSVSIAHTSFGGAMIADRLPEALTIFADLVLRPHLPAEQLEDARQVCLQEVRSIEDDLAQKVMQELRRRKYGEPWGRAGHGTIESVESISLADVQRSFDSAYRPNGAILSVAGKIEWEPLLRHVTKLFEKWQPREYKLPPETPGEGGSFHFPHESSQTHIGVSFESVPYSHPDYFQARGAVGVLSDGMSSRLFTEVRENRGLCYSVYAASHSLRERGSVLCYAGTSSERAQETLDVLAAELVKLAAGVRPDELGRLKAQIKSSLVMQQESSRSRSSSIAGDWYYLGRVRTMEELSRIIDGLSCESINTYLAAHPPRDFGIVTLGASPLEPPRAVP